MPYTRSQERERRVNYRLDALEGAIEEMANHINNYMRSNQAGMDAVGRLANTVGVVSNNVVEVNNNIRELANTVQVMSTAVQNHDAFISDLKVASSQHETDIEGLKEELNSLKRTIETMSATESGHQHSS